MRGTEAERFWAKVTRTESCWIWTAYTQPNGYGMFRRSPERRCMAHRMAYELCRGPIPEGLTLDHTCHNRACVNPGHLRPVTDKQNKENLSGLRSNNTSGHQGVIFNERLNRWYARAQHHGKQYSAGGHATPEEAAEAARQLRLSLFTHNDLDRKPTN